MKVTSVFQISVITGAATFLFGTVADSTPLFSNGLKSRPQERLLEAANKREAFEILELWISQLNAETKSLEESKDNSARIAKSKLATRYVYAIELQFSKLNLYNLSVPEKTRTERDLQLMNPNAKALYEQDLPRWRKQMDDNLHHGEEQVKAMLGSHPEMKRFVSPGDPVWKWTVRQFAGEAIGSKIYWSAEAPQGRGHRTAEHSLEYRRAYSDNLFYFHRPYQDPKGLIRLKSFDDNKQPYNGEQLWSVAVFELENIQNSPQFHKALEEALSGKLNEKQWISKTTQLEFEALNKTALFYRTVWFPHVKQKGLSTNPHYWWIDAPNTYAGWISMYKERTNYPFDSWGAIYSKDILPARERMRRQQTESSQFQEIGRQNSERMKRQEQERKESDSAEEK